MFPRTGSVSLQLGRKDTSWKFPSGLWATCKRRVACLYHSGVGSCKHHITSGVEEEQRKLVRSAAEWGLRLSRGQSGSCDRAVFSFSLLPPPLHQTWSYLHCMGGILFVPLETWRRYLDCGANIGVWELLCFQVSCCISGENMPVARLS